MHPCLVAAAQYYPMLGDRGAALMCRRVAGTMAGSIPVFRRTFFSATAPCLKKSGKPLDTPDYKQVYLPYEVAPTAAEIERHRKAFSQAPHFITGKKIPVRDVPANMYTFGKEGMSIPIAIFKDQPDPVIGPEWTYPGIYENKIVARPRTLEMMAEMEMTGKWPSPWVKGQLTMKVNHLIGSAKGTMKVLSWTEKNRFMRERGVSAAKGKAAPAKAADPDKKAAAKK